MFVYNYRLFDRYKRPVASLAVLADAHKRWKPDSYGFSVCYNRWRGHYCLFCDVRFCPHDSPVGGVIRVLALLLIAYLRYTINWVANRLCF